MNKTRALLMILTLFATGLIASSPAQAAVPVEPDHTVYCENAALRPDVVEWATGKKILGYVWFRCKNGSGVPDRLDKMIVTVQLQRQSTQIEGQPYSNYGIPTRWQCGAGTSHPTCPTEQTILASAPCVVKYRYRSTGKIEGWEDGKKDTYVPAPSSGLSVYFCKATEPGGKFGVLVPADSL